MRPPLPIVLNHPATVKLIGGVPSITASVSTADVVAPSTSNFPSSNETISGVHFGAKVQNSWPHPGSTYVRPTVRENTKREDERVKGEGVR